MREREEPHLSEKEEKAFLNALKDPKARTELIRLLRILKIVE